MRETGKRHSRQPSPRMAQLLDAAVVVTAEQGLRGLTHRAVDRQAALPEGSCSAYFRTRQALITGVATYVADRLGADVRALTERIAGCQGDTEDVLREVSSMLLGWVAEPHLLQTKYELTLEGSRVPELAELQAGWAATLQDLIADVAPGADAEVFAQVMLAASDGLLLRALREPTDERADHLRTSLRLLLRGLNDAAERSDPGVG